MKYPLGKNDTGMKYPLEKNDMAMKYSPGKE
jgi:hypothetical protein